MVRNWAWHASSRFIGMYTYCFWVCICFELLPKEELALSLNLIKKLLEKEIPHSFALFTQWLSKIQKRKYEGELPFLFPFLYLKDCKKMDNIKHEWDC